MSRGKQIRARARTRRRVDHGEINGWAATKAAANLVHRRDEVLARSGENPIKREVDKAQLAETLQRFTARLVERGRPPDHARLLALTLMTHAQGLSVDDPELIDQLERRDRDGQLTPLRSGEPYVISPTMHAAVVAAAGTLTKENIAGWRTDDLITERGVLLLPNIQLVHANGCPLPDEIIMLSWHTGIFSSPVNAEGCKVLYLTAWFDSDGPVRVPEFTAARDFAARSGHPFPRFGAATTRRCPLDLQAASGSREDLVDVMVGVAGEHQSALATVGEYSGEVINVADVAQWAHQYLFAFMGLAQQRIATVQPFRELRPDNRKPLRHDDVRVVQLRSYSPLGDVDQPRSDRQHHHRWVVRMHKVNQWYPSEGVHKVIWRGPYIKGPAHAPLLAGEKVHALVR